jgi:hypothetical protein
MRLDDCEDAVNDGDAVGGHSRNARFHVDAMVLERFVEDGCLLQLLNRIPRIAVDLLSCQAMCDLLILCLVSCGIKCQGARSIISFSVSSSFSSSFSVSSLSVVR